MKVSPFPVICTVMATISKFIVERRLPYRSHKLQVSGDRIDLGPKPLVVVREIGRATSDPALMLAPPFGSFRNLTGSNTIA